MKKCILTFIILWVLITCKPVTVYASQWCQDNIGWWYAKDDGTYVQNEWYKIEGQWYFFNQEGYCLTNTLTPDGYWLDENGYFNEQKRIYSKCVFNPASYVKVGNRYLITGDICDTGYMSQNVIDQIQPGDMIVTPSISNYDRVCEFNFMQPVAGIIDKDGKRTLVTSYIYRDVRLEWLGWSETGNLIEQNYYLNSQEMYGDATDSMDWPIYRIVEKNVTLVADTNTDYKSMIDEFFTLESCLEAWTGNGWSDRNKVLEIYLNGNYIEEAINIEANYAG